MRRGAAGVRAGMLHSHALVTRTFFHRAGMDGRESATAAWRGRAAFEAQKAPMSRRAQVERQVLGCDVTCCGLNLEAGSLRAKTQ